MRSRSAWMSLRIDQVRDLACHGVGVLLDGELREDGFEGGQFHERTQVRDGVVGDKLAAMKNDDSVADAFDGVEFVGTEEHDFAARGEFRDESAQNES